MKAYKKIKICLLLVLITSTYMLAQETEVTEPVDSANTENIKRFHAGLYVGSYFANNYTASAYDGYGFNIDGGKNDFLNSLMYQKIIMQHGGINNQPDQIAQELNVDHSDWTFNESDMPVNMHYTPAFLIGLNCRYAVTRKNIVLLNLNTSKVNVTGNFTIYTKPPSNSTQINKSVLTFPITGSENRLMVQLGYQRLVGNSEQFNFFYEAGLLVTLARIDKNWININKLKIDLFEPYNQAQYPSSYPVANNTRAGVGAFAGCGLNLTLNPKWILQVLYTPTYENINAGLEPKLKLQHAIGLRGYYNL
jgi:hypothetical protein